MGFLFLSSAGDFRIDGFREGLRDYGYVEGGNIVIEYRFADGAHSRLAGLAAELVELKLDLIVTHSVGADFVKATGTKIPVVFAITGDARRKGLIDSMSRPGGNFTGSEFFDEEMVAKRFDLLKELSPGLSRVAVLLNPNVGILLDTIRQTASTAAAHLGMESTAFYARSASDLERAFGDMADQRIQAVVIQVEPTLVAAATEIATLALRHRLLSVAQAEFCTAGGLMGYGPNISALYRRVGYFVDRILKGAYPGDLPVERPTKFDFALNLGTAKTLGIEFPASLLAQTDTVIE